MFEQNNVGVRLENPIAVFVSKLNVIEHNADIIQFILDITNDILENIGIF
jgi:hypothetical protein